MQNGITLIALIITIILMLILAGVVLSLTIGERGIFKTAQGAGKNYINASKRELADLNSLEENLQSPKSEETNDETTLARYLLIEVNGHLSGNSTAINELELYDNNKNKINYNVLPDLEYDTVTNGKSYYWEDGKYWNYTNLNDGATSYTYIEEGGQNCTIFLFNWAVGIHHNESDWARFIIDLGEEKNIKQIKVNVGGTDGRTPAKISIYKINKFVDGIENDSTYQKNIITRDDNGLTKISQIEFSDVASFSSWYYFTGENLEIPKNEEVELARYLLIEVNGHLSGNSAVVNELEVYDKFKNKINYNVLPVLEYDSITNGKSYYWEDERYWNYTNLNDEATSYTYNEEGGQNCTIFLYNGSNTYNSDGSDWARFIIDLGEEYYIKDIDIDMWLGGTDGRMPYKINIFAINHFVDGIEGENTTYSNNIKQRNNEGLTLVSAKTFSENPTQATKFNLLTH